MTKCAFHEDVNQPYFPDLNPPRPREIDSFQKEILQIFRTKLNDINTQAAKLIRDIQDNRMITIGGDLSTAIQVLRWSQYEWDYLDRLDVARENLQKVIAVLEKTSITAFDRLIDLIGSGISVSTQVAIPQTNDVVLAAEPDLNLQHEKPRLLLVG